VRTALLASAITAGVILLFVLVMGFARAAERDFDTASIEGAKTLEDHIKYCEGTYGDYHGEIPTKAQTRAKAANVNRCIAEAKGEFADATTYEDCRDNAKDYEGCVKQLKPSEQCREYLQDGEAAETPQQQADYDRCLKQGRARLTVTPPYQGPQPIGWVYGPYTQCANPPQCSMGVVSVGADGLNVRVTPNGPPIMALVNGTPFYPIGRDRDWLLVASAWSWNAGVPLNRCWVYF
jgi:hypothetical protein